MIKLNTVLGNVMVLVLLSCFSWRVWQSGQKLFDDKIGLSVSEEFSDYRLFPSLSICLFMKNMTRDFVPENVDGNLQRLLNDVLVDFAHRNGSEHMWVKTIIILIKETNKNHIIFKQKISDQQICIECTCFEFKRAMHLIWSAWTNSKVVEWGEYVNIFSSDINSHQLMIITVSRLDIKYFTHGNK